MFIINPYRFNGTPEIVLISKDNMTSDSDGGYVATASGYATSYYPYKAFNSTTVPAYDFWCKTGTSGWIQQQIPNAKTPVKYTLQSCHYQYFPLSTMPKDWNFYGSNNGVDYTLLDTRSNQTAWGDLEVREFTFTNSTSFLYFKLDITLNNGYSEYTALDELKVYGY